MSKLILGNSKEIITSMPDNSVQMVLTDPLYDMPKEEQLWFQSEFERVCSGNILVFGAPENIWPFEKLLFWVKQPSTKNYSRSFGRFVETISLHQRGTYHNDEYWGNYTGVYNDTLEGPRVHGFQKPVSLLERFLRILSNPGDIVFDPFCGSGSTLLAAKNLGREYVGIEMNPETYELAKSRIGEEL